MCQILCFAPKVQRNVPIKEFIVQGRNYPTSMYSPPILSLLPAVPSNLSLCLLAFFSHVLESFPRPHPLLLLWCDSAVLADTPEGEIQLPLLACACAAGLGWRKANSHSDWFYLKFLTVNLRCTLTYFHLLSSFLEDYFILFFF